MSSGDIYARHSAGEALRKLISDYTFNSVLDIGSGAGNHALTLKNAGKTATTIDLSNADINSDYNCYEFDSAFDAIWCSHCLEHQLNVNSFLRKVFHDLKMGGVLAVTVPPLKHSIVGGHVTLWNAGLLLYNLILAGFDCSQASVKAYGYNLSVIVEKKPISLPDLNRDFGDINILSRYFPIPVSERFDGRIDEVNW